MLFFNRTECMKSLQQLLFRCSIVLFLCSCSFLSPNLHFLFCVFFLFLLPYSHVFVLLGLLSFCYPRSSCLFFLFFCLLFFSFFEFFLFSSFVCHYVCFPCFLHLLLPSPSCSLCSPASFPLLFSAFFLFFVLCFLSPRSFCSSRSPSPFCSQEVRSISPFFRLAILDRLSYIYIYVVLYGMYIYMIYGVIIYIYMCGVYIYIFPFFAQESRSWWMAPRCIWRAWPGIRCPRAVRTLQTWTSPQR